MKPADLDALRALRQRFLAHRTGGGYWQSREELALYDRTFGERIGWKWDGVLRELAARHWRPASDTVLDWGCGSGVATRRVLAQWPGQFHQATLFDSSHWAREFAREAVRAGDHRVRVEAVEEAFFPPDGLVLLSHVLNELTDQQIEGLVASLRAVREIIWVESSTHVNSRRLVAEVRERLVGSGDFAVVAPCPHRQQCGLFLPENEHHWCHSFAAPPREIFRNAEWMQMGRELGIDLRSTPYAFLVLRKVGVEDQGLHPVHTPEKTARVLGRTRDYKGYSKVLSCEASGVRERILQKRDAPTLLKEVQAGEQAVPIYRWTLEKEKIVAGSPVFSDPGSDGALPSRERL